MNAKNLYFDFCLELAKNYYEWVKFVSFTCTIDFVII